MASHTTRPVLWGLLVCFTVLGCPGKAQNVTLEVKDGNNTCIKAELSASFSILYSVTNGTETASTTLPSTATLGVNSSCSVPMLTAVFGNNNSLSFSFIRSGSQYLVQNLSLTYNLGDGSIFPNSSVKGVVTKETNSTGMRAEVNTTYRCQSVSLVSLAAGEVNISFSHMRMEAYMPANNLSSNETVCTADQPVTTTAPSTTTSPKTSATPTPPLAKPEQGIYNVTNANGSVCILAQMGLQLNLTYLSISQNKTVQGIVNMQPNQTKSSGSCDANAATMLLISDGKNLTFSFTLNTTSNKYHLSGISVAAVVPDASGPIVASNSDVDYFTASVGHSYTCQAEQMLSVNQNSSINTFGLRVQPFGISKDTFGAEEKCLMDEDNMLIPIIVGAALAGLVLIVLIAYLIGRKRSHAGYQTI